MASSTEQLITIIGRGHSGTRALSHALYASGVFMGHTLSHRGDTLPPRQMYEACRIVARHVRWTGDLTWDFDDLHQTPIDPEFEVLVRKYLRNVLCGETESLGWKLPETTLAFPWIARMLPEVRYLHIVRDPRDGLLKSHRNTDDLRNFDVPVPEFDDELARRVASWKYQYDIVKATPPPKHFITVRFEDLVLKHEDTMQRLEGFLGIPLARIVVDETRVGQWRTNQRVVPFVAPLADDMRELGYES